jgi:hypothetical protein
VEPDRCSKHAKTPGGSQGNVNVEFRLAQRQVGDQVSVRTPVATKTKHQLPIAARCTFQITIQHMQSTRRKMIPFLQSQHFFKQVSAYSLRRFCCVCMCHVHHLYCPHVHVFHVFKHVCFFVISLVTVSFGLLLETLFMQPPCIFSMISAIEQYYDL